MKKFIAKIEKLELELNSLLEKRDHSYYSKTEQWQQSEKGVEYHNKSETLRETLFNIEQAKDNLEQL